MHAETPPASIRNLHKEPRVSEAVGLIGHLVVSQAYEGQYPWEKVRPMARQAGIDPELAWIAVKIRRLGAQRKLPLVDDRGQAFWWMSLGSLNQALHEIDLSVGGGGAAAFDADEGVLSDPETKARIKIRSLMDEAMESAIMEGAAVTRDDARDVLRSGREPINTYERMVVNNYRAMLRIKDVLADPLSPQMLLDLQAGLTDRTFKPDEEHKRGRFRSVNDPVRIEDEEQNVLFTPPSAIDLPVRLKRVCEFANAKHEGSSFIHPLIKACMLHFMIGYEHPFCDGNGRTARAVFYWYALRSKYPIFEVLVISEIIGKARSQYTRAYLHTEADDGDVTYFLDFHIRVIQQAIGRLRKHIERESRQIKRSLDLVASNKQLNLRQRLLLEHALRHATTVYTVASHQRSYGIAINTARADLEALVKAGFLITSQAGRATTYHLSPNGLKRLQQSIKA